MKRLIRMDARDTVATALEDVAPGDEAGVYDAENHYICSLTALGVIPFGNKLALIDAKEGDRVLKYGAVIGACTRAFRAGTLVHVHNVKSLTVDIPSAIQKEIMRQMQINAGEEV